jgi:outer membrane protein OmpA-like peptidoglycan-associated protein
MMIAALLALAAGAIAGIFLATRHFLRKRLPASVALFHGIGGATGFALVLLTVVREPEYRPIREVLYLLIATVLLGAINLLFHIRKVRHRTSLILLHGATAATAAIWLIRAIWIHVPPDSSQAATAATASAAVPAASTPVATASAAETVEPKAKGPDAGTDASAGKAATPEFVVDARVQKVLDRPIQFGSNNAGIGDGARANIAQIASILARHPEIELLEVQGHADERGDEARNVELTRTRAAAVVDALVASGIARERLHDAGYGARCPADPTCASADAPDSCHGPAGWQRDRRVALVVLQVNKAPFRGKVVCDRGADLIPSDDQRFHAADR